MKMVNSNKNKFFQLSSQSVYSTWGYRLFLSTFQDSFFGIQNISFVSKLRARRVVVKTELCSHFPVAHAFGLNFLRIQILGLDLNWQNVRLGKLVLHYIELQVLWLLDLLRQQRLNLRLRGQANLLFERQLLWFNELTHSRQPLSWW